LTVARLNFFAFDGSNAMLFFDVTRYLIVCA